MEEVRQGDIGTVIKQTMWASNTGAVLPINGATLLEMLFSKPDGTCVKVEAGLYSDGLDGIVAYTVPDGDFLDVLGVWSLQSIVTFTTGTWASTEDNFKVVPRICAV